MNNIKELRLKYNITQQKLAKLLNVHQTAVSQWENGRTQPELDVVMKMAKLFHMSVEEILGQAPIITPRSGIRIPVIGVSAAGIPICAIEEHIDDDDPDTWEEISEKLAASGTFVAIRIKGDSMAPNIQEKDILIVRVQDDVDNGDIAIVFVNGDEVTCKKIKKTPEGVMLIPFNPEYDTMFYTNAEIESLPVRIYGKVIETRRKY